MKTVFTTLILLLVFGSSSAYHFVYQSNYEENEAGEEIVFQPTDSLFGSIFSNDCFYCEGDAPYVSGTVYTNCLENPCGFPAGQLEHSGYDVDLEDQVEVVAQAAAAQGLYYGLPQTQYYAQLRGTAVRLWYWQEGAPFDSLSANFEIIGLYGSGTYLYIDAPLRVSGEFLGGDLIIGCSEDIVFVDNTYLSGTNLETGELPDNPYHHYLAFVAGGSIVIRNSPANGRVNSDSLGNEQTDISKTDIVITAVLMGLSDEGGIRIDQPNNEGDSYVCPCTPDLRGDFILNGAIIVNRRGPLFNHNRGGTGYRLKWRFDERLIHFSIYPFGYAPVIDPDTLRFDSVLAGGSAINSVTITALEPVTFSGAFVTYSFYSNAGYKFSDSISIPVTFTPPHAGYYSGLLYFYLDGDYYSVPLQGTAIDPPAAQGLAFNSHPNPFNASTVFEFTLPRAGDVELIVYDVLGREAERMKLTNAAAGANRIYFDAGDLPSGVYFAKLSAAGQTATQKILLIK